MAFLPWENIEIKTKLTKDEIISGINNNVEAKGLFWAWPLKKYSYGKPYQGYISENSFKIMRITIYTNSFLPFILGNIIENEDYRIITIKMRCSYIITGFMIIFIGFSLLSGLNYIITDGIGGGFFGSMFFSIIGYIIMTGAFKIESIKSKKFLRKLFNEENGFIK